MSEEGSYRDRYDWNQVLYDYVEGYLEQKGLDEEGVRPKDLDSYPEPGPTSENEFLLAMKHVKREVNEMLEGVEA